MQLPVQSREGKVFCIGFNKTGTTSVRVALEELGYRVASQPVAELFITDWARRDFSRISDFCQTADAFQDIPFSLPYTYQTLDASFPGSKFILTIRANSEMWYHSLVVFHSKLFGGGKMPTEDDLARADYCYRGWVLFAMRTIYAYPAGDPYNKKCLIRAYESHIASVQEYFSGRSADLLTVDLATKASYQRFCKFLGKTPLRPFFPWENRGS
ncbi:sulfotransferase [Cyanobium usitatum]|jgi:hypothetical protein|uniref:sulfotransferase n=1 Tax=Cyanobium usitatum TaxID=2304190 RepID=UPI002AD50AE2|nr:sulfotransferase [Cyanobium usitatum]